MFNVKRFNFDEEAPSKKSTDRDGGRLARAKQAADAETQRLEQLHQQASKRRIQQQERNAKVEQEQPQQVASAANKRSRGGTHQIQSEGNDRKRLKGSSSSSSSSTSSSLSTTTKVRALNRRQRRRLERSEIDPTKPVGKNETAVLAAGGRVLMHSTKNSNGSTEEGSTAAATTTSTSLDTSTASTASTTTTTTTTTTTAVPTLKQDGKEWGLDKDLVKALKANKIHHFFPIQRRALPLILNGDVKVGGLHEDVCVSAPTGSGKTLVFAIAAIQTLKDRVVPRCRALVVLPSRELAVQVHTVFTNICKAMKNTRLVKPLQVALAVSGRTSFAMEQPAVLSCDILVCTPGRLLEHLRANNSSFTLEHLKLLIVDEADRLLSQSYQRWVPVVLQRSTQQESRGEFTCPTNNAATFHIVPRTYRGVDSYDAAHTSSLFDGRVRKLLFSATLTTNPQHLSSLELLNPRFISMEESTPDFAAHVLSTPTTSADATTAPRPFRTPDTLKECVVTCTTETKPLLLAMLLRAIHQQNNQCNVLIFTGTVKNTHRLCRLLQILDVMEHHPAVRTAATLGGSSSDSSSDSGSDSGGSDAEEHVGREEEDVHSHARSLLPYLSQTSVLEYSSMVPAKQRASHLKRFAAAPSTNNNKQHHQRQCRVLVCSDAGARGLDIEQVTDVINYDVPNEAKTYVHRVGRTARAGRNGTAYTMLKPGQMGSYHSMMKSITHNAIQVYPTQSERVEVLKELYVKSLTVLKQVMELEEDEGQ